MRKAIIDFYPVRTVFSTILLSLIFTLSLNSQCDPGVISGNVFIDIDNNGVNNNNELGKSGVLIKAFNANGLQIGQTQSASNGDYEIPGLFDGQDYLIRFEIPDGHFQGMPGVNNKTNVQFVKSPACDADFGILDSNSNCGINSPIAVTCFVNSNGTNEDAQETIIGLTHNFDGSSEVTVYANKGETGSVWGMAYNDTRRHIYSASFVKQNADLTVHGHDAIFRTDISSGSPVTHIFTTLSSLGQDVGTLDVTDASDCNYGKQVGKIGLGALAIDDTNDYLYATNQYNNSIVSIDLNNTVAATTRAYPVPNPGCSFNDFNVYALKYHEDALYVGVTCTAETSQSEDDTYMHVYRFNLVTEQFELIFSSDYISGVWDLETTGVITSSQWLTDIDFTDDGNMILALSDRFGHTFCNAATSRVDDQYGDLLIVENLNGVWTLENNGQLSDKSGTGVGNGQGPGGGEFFGDDFFPLDRNNHPEVSLGSVLIIPETNQIVSAVFDPLFNTYSGGLHRYRTDNGAKVAAQELYNTNIANYFGKATGFGEIISLCGQLRPAAGNLVWIDENCDGLQNGGEPGVSGLTMNIYDSSCNKIGTTVTDANGNYLFDETNVDLDQDGQFDGLNFEDEYFIAVDASFYDAINQSYVINDIYYHMTDYLDYDDELNSDPQNLTYQCAGAYAQSGQVIEFTASAGYNSGFDIGIKAATDFDLALTKVHSSTPDIINGDIVTFDIKVYNQGHIIASEYEIVDYIPEAYEFVASMNSGWTLDTDGNARKVVRSPLLPSLYDVHKIYLRLKSTNNPNDYINYSEIVYAKDNFGIITDDIDSTPDGNRENDNGGVVDSSTDDMIMDDGSVDEDDHDPATVRVLDLALKNVIRDVRYYDIGEVATFEITVCNQGNIAVNGFDVIDYFPLNYIFPQAQNPGWTMINPETVTFNSDQLLNPGEKRTIELRLQVRDNNNFDDIVNVAEISSIESSVPSVTRDIDSTPDAISNNDKGGNPYDSTDNLITDDGTIDEDDHDPAYLAVRLIDLALMKTVENQVYNPGDIVTFDITIYNQGEIDVQSVMLADYLPQNTSLFDSNWQVDANDSSGRTVFTSIYFENGFKPGEQHKIKINVKVDTDVPSGYVINHAEIAQVIDMNGADVSHLDIDSEPDMLPDNDIGGEFATITDDNIFDDGTMDEDDHDPSGFYIADITITGACTCLENASTFNDGQFLEEITVTAPEGQSWYIDSVFELYDPTSLAPPAAPTPYTTGPMGYMLTEVPYTADLSYYVLEGKFIDGMTYTIRVTNGEGAFLQVTGGGEDCSYSTEYISSATDGLSAVCAGSLHTYTFDNPAGCNNYTWSISSGGSIVGSTTGSTVNVQWDNVSGGPHTLMLTPSCPGLCLTPIATDVNIGTTSTIISCLSHINVSLDQNCSLEMDPMDLLTSEISPGMNYQLMLTDRLGNLIPNNLLTDEHLWEDVTAKVVDPCSGNSCWGTITVEDKMAPLIQCGDIAMPCWLMNTYEPLVLDNCTDATFELIGETINPLNCDPDYIKEITRTYIAIDAYGNESTPCVQNIQLERLDFADIDFPQDYLLSDNTQLTCSDSLYNENGEPSLSITGVPTLFGNDLYPIQDLYCNVGIEYEDIVVSEFGCIRKIMRTWTVYESWCTVGTLQTWVQTIEIADLAAPVPNCPEDITISADGGPNCEATLNLPMPTATDDCSTEFIIDISYDGGFIQNVTSAPLVVLESGLSKITYNIYDQCENLTSCLLNITVMDETAPVAVCDENTVVSLRSDGTAKAFAHTFDDGSYDDCSLFNVLVRRMNSNCDCDRPEFDDMRYLGEYNGRFYYLSRFQTHGNKAFLYSAAYGGTLLTTESEEEHDWVFEQANKFIDGNYYVGLSDADHPGDFTWPNHAEPIFNRWAGGAPVNVGDNVIVNNMGDWVVVNGNNVEAYYVMELSDPCGFSDEIHFCCEDAAEEQMVLFRAIDYFGRTNECMVNVEVQDKVAPNISCPPSRDISCELQINLDDLSQFGEATASDQCTFALTDTITDLRNNCGFGDIIRTFIASDNNGFSTCNQVLTVINTNPFNNTVVWPEDFDTDLGCDSGDLHPDNLPIENAYPTYDEDNCGLVAASFEDEIFVFSGTGTPACLKILRTWTIIDWCQMDDPGYEPAVYEQTIKVTNTIGPEILSGCDTLTVNTLECEFEEVIFTAVATDDCTADDNLIGTMQIDIDIDGMGTYDITNTVTTNVIGFTGNLPIGQHLALISFEDQCNNVTSCAKIINVVNIVEPVAVCVTGLTVALEPMDLDGDGTPDTEMACVFPEMVDASSTHACGNDINLSFSQDTAFDKLAFDCADLGINIIHLWVTDEFGNTDSCETTVEVQDNNMVDFCPRFDLALTKKLDTAQTQGPFNIGDPVSFIIEVINQGNQNAFDIGIVDYIPDGLTLNDEDWSITDGKAFLNDNIAFLEDSTSTTVTIDFVISDGFMGTTIVNTAEISEADNDNDPNNELMEDSDSESDDEDDDNVGGDNEVDNDNNDEDDHDPETIEVIQVFDLALDKDCAANSPSSFSPGDFVTYVISIENEGTLNATNVNVVDYVPVGLVLADTDWTLELSGAATLNDPIALIGIGETATVDITFQIANDFMGNSITNVAEISDPDNLLPMDNDSTPNNDDGDQSEDDEDAKEITVNQVFDLALTKTINTTATPGPYEPGSDVTFDITVYNQGSLDANTIEVVDYIPAGFTFVPANNSDFGLSGGNATATIGVLDSDDSVTLSLTLTVADNFSGSELINNAEIVSANNAFNLVDQDSDLADTNDGSSNELSTDNDIDDDRAGTPGTMDNPNDEDDYDPARVEVDCTLAPVCSALPDFTVSLDADGNASISAQDIDNGSTATCDNTTLVLQIDNSTFDCTDIGSGNTVTLTVTDSNGNVSTNNCQTDVTVTDELDPVVECQDVDIVWGGNGIPVISLASVVTSATDNCMVSDTTIDLSGVDLNTLVCVPMMAGVIVTDQSGNTDRCEFLVTVIDNDPPVCSLASDITIDAETTITADDLGIVVTGLCPGEMFTTVVMPDMFPCEDVGTQIVTVTVTDENGNSSTCSAEVTVIDNTMPVCNAMDITIQLDAMGQATITANDVDGGSTAGCVDPTLAVTPSSFDCDDVGVNVVTLTVTASNGMTAQCTANVTVEDNMNPELDCPTDVSFDLDANGNISLVIGDVTNSISDNCAIVTQTLSEDTFDCEDIGANVVTVTVTDEHSNTSTCAVNVVVEDNLNPNCALFAGLTFPPNMTIDLGDLFMSYNDNCNINAATAVLDQDIFDCTMLGLNTVTLTVTDDSGNSNTCSTEVTIEDIPAPVCVPMDITVFLNDIGEYNLTAEEIDGGSFGGCSPIELSAAPTFFGCNTTQNNPTCVTLTVTATNTNVSTQCEAKVTALDTLPPMITCMDVTLDLDASGEVTVLPTDVANATDECTVTGITITPNMFDCSDKDTPTAVTVVATDESGNTAQCIANVTVEDNMDPTCTVAANLTAAPNTVITVTQVLGTFSDNCAANAVNSSVMPNMFDCTQLGDQVITLQVEDECGNSSTCTGTITIEDNSVPVCMTQDITVTLDENGNATIDAEDIDNGSTSACNGGSIMLEVDPDTFDCGDLGANVVTLTVTAVGGASSTCTATVTVVDDMEPTVVCPADMNIPCNSDISNLDIFGEVTATDNCDMFLTVEETNVTSVNTCNVGFVTRTFEVTDDSGNSATCMQTITIDGPVNPITLADITFPVSPFNAGDCIMNPDSIDSGMPFVDTTNADCFNLSISFTDTNNGGTMCSGSITRTWTVIDSCQAPNGVFTFDQLIILDDTVGPDISGPNDITIILGPGNTTCDTFVSLPATVSDCAPGFTVMNDSPFADDNTIADASGTYPVGTTTVNITATDVCGNDSIYTYNVSIVDTTAFITDCAKIFINIDMNNLNAVVTTDMAQVMVTSDCATNIFDESFSGTTPDQDTIVRDCDDIGFENYTIYLWVGNVVVDSCTSLLQIADGGGFCNSPLAGNITGTVSMENGKMVDNVTVDLIGSSFSAEVTDIEGAYAFPMMNFGGAYDIVPVKDMNPMNGVSTRDLIDIQKHILGTQKLDSPYKLIAADIDRSGSITSKDLLELRKLILGVYDDFPENTSWRMVDSAHEFVDPTNPFALGIPEVYEIFEFSADMEVDFVGVKVGDVNNSAVANAHDKLIDDRDSDAYKYTVADRFVEAGETVEIEMGLNDLDQLKGLQHSLIVDADLAEILSIESNQPDFNSINWNEALIERGIVNLSWNRQAFNGNVSDNEEVLFTMTLVAKDDAYVSELLSFDDTNVKAEAYLGSETKDIAIEFTNTEESEAFVLHQNNPNPWTQQTQIKFYAPVVQDYDLKVFDVDGRLLYNVEGESKIGMNSIIIENYQIQTKGGMLYYEFVSGSTRLMNKMLLIK